jgi:hypothetical protein
MHLNNKLIGWIVVVLIVGGALYSMLSNSSAPAATTDASGNATTTVGADLLALLGKLQTVNFSTDLFSNSNFNGLIDFAIPLPTPALGRPNPFAPIGTDVGPVIATPTSQQTGTVSAGTTTPAH